MDSWQVAGCGPLHGSLRNIDSRAAWVPALVCHIPELARSGCEEAPWWRDPLQYNGSPKRDMPDDQEQLSFEQGCERLEAIVQQLEDGELSLERSLELFEQGVHLSRNCRKQLEEAETRVEILMKKGGDRSAEPFQLDENSG